MILVRVFAVVWLLGVVRVVGAVVRDETFGGEATIALLMTLLLPWVIGDLYSAQRRRKNESAGP